MTTGKFEFRRAAAFSGCTAVVRRPVPWIKRERHVTRRCNKTANRIRISIQNAKAISGVRNQRAWMPGSGIAGTESDAKNLGLFWTMQHCGFIAGHQRHERSIKCSGRSGVDSPAPETYATPLVHRMPPFPSFDPLAIPARRPVASIICVVTFGALSFRKILHHSREYRHVELWQLSAVWWQGFVVGIRNRSSVALQSVPVVQNHGGTKPASPTGSPRSGIADVD